MQKYNLNLKTKFFVGVNMFSHDTMPLGLRPRAILSLLGTLYPIEHSRPLSNPYLRQHSNKVNHLLR